MQTFWIQDIYMKNFRGLTFLGGNPEKHFKATAAPAALSCLLLPML